MEVQQTNFQFENLLQDVMEWLEPLLEEKSLQHELVFLSDAPVMLYSDSGKIRQVLINLLGNAIKFTESGGHIKVSCIHDVNGVSIEIKDTGCGITADQQQQIFEVFHQVNPSGILKGTGLGLALVQSLMKLLGGSVSLKSKYGKGSTFTLYFPASRKLKHES